MLKRNNYIFRPQDIFDFSYSQFDTVRDKYNRSDIKE
jgi:hypothetical protein